MNVKLSRNETGTEVRIPTGPAELLTTSQAAALSKCSTQTIINWCNNGHIPDGGFIKGSTGRYRVYWWALRDVLGMK